MLRLTVSPEEYLMIGDNIKIVFLGGSKNHLRISDILKLRWNDVYDFQNKRYRSHICLVEQKTGKKTMIAVNHSLHEALIRRAVFNPIMISR